MNAVAQGARGGACEPCAFILVPMLSGDELATFSAHSIGSDFNHHGD